MLKWTPYVMVRIVLFFTAGILLAIYQPHLVKENVVLITVISGIPVYYTAYLLMRNRHVLRLVTGVIGLIVIFLFGYLHLVSSTDSRSQDHLLSVHDQIQYYEATVRSAPESKSKSWRLEVEVIKVKTNEWLEKKGKVLLYISKSSIDYIPWQYGDRLLIKGNPIELKPPANPHEFDFKRFLSFKNIYHQQFVSAKQIQWVEHTQRKSFLYYSIQARAWATSKLNQYIDGDQQKLLLQRLYWA